MTVTEKGNKGKKGGINMIYLNMNYVDKRW